MNVTLAKRMYRFGAAFFNSLLLYIAVFLALSVSNALRLDGDLIGLIMPIAAILVISIQIRYIYRYQQTIAKRLLNIQVVSWKTKEPLSIYRYILREVVAFIGYQLSILFIIDVIMVFTTKEKRTLTDMIFSTVVIEKI